MSGDSLRTARKLDHDLFLCLKIICGRALEPSVVTHISQKHMDIAHLHLEAWAHLAMYAANAYRFQVLIYRQLPVTTLCLALPRSEVS